MGWMGRSWATRPSGRAWSAQDLLLPGQRCSCEAHVDQFQSEATSHRARDWNLLRAVRARAVHAGSMESAKAAGERGDETSAQRQAMADREHAADDREHAADDREHAANEREHGADEREREADRRETALTERQRQIDERERELDERGQVLGGAVHSAEQRALETVERSRELLALSGPRVSRHEAAVRRTQQRQARKQAGLGRAVAEIKRDHAAVLPDPGEAIERAKALRQQALAAMEAFAATEEDIACAYEQLAGRRPDHRDDYRHIAEQARTSARKAREALRRFNT
jgi:hypothetical protein